MSEGPDLSVTLPEEPELPDGTVIRFLPRPCCAGGGDWEDEEAAET